MKKIITIVLLFIIVLLLLYANSNSTSQKIKRTLSINDITLDIQIARTNEDKQKGLGGVEKLEKNEGMLFLMGQKSKYSFWMKDMLIPIDIIWIEDNKIVDITKNVPVAKDAYLPLYQPKIPVNYVLEVEAGFTDLNSINVGDLVTGLDKID